MDEMRAAPYEHIDQDRPSVPTAQLEQLLQLQRDALEMIAVGRETVDILNQRCRLAEAMVPNSVASIMLLDETRSRLVMRAVPSIPAEAIGTLNGLKPGPYAGSCATAVYHSKPVFVDNTMHDRRWLDFRSFAERFNLHACWSMPVRVANKDGDLCGHVSVFADITETKESERKLWQLAHGDALCDLPNRLLLSARLQHALKRAHRAARMVALLFIDLDRFKNINDSLGHQAGDELLRDVARRLQAAMHEDDTVARLDGDEFVVLIEDIDDAYTARHVAERIAARLQKPVTLCDKSLVVTASIGISIFPADASDADVLLQHADAAMYQAKAQGRNCIAYYAPELTRQFQQRLELEHDLRLVLANGEFLLHYQPQVTAADGRLVAVEALLRWNHPQRGMVPPNDFIPVAEETGLIRDIGCWVTETACREAAERRDAGHTDFILAINLSPYQLRSESAERLNDLFRRTGFPADRFEFEVTETLLIEDGGLAFQQLAVMREQIGMNIAMDDFGTGHSSLSQLKLLPIGKLKIDRSFISHLPHDANDAAIVKAIILMAHTLGLQVVAEGVETPEQHHFLCRSGCDHLQGYLFAKPMPAERLSQLLASDDLKIDQIGITE